MLDIVRQLEVNAQLFWTGVWHYDAGDEAGSVPYHEELSGTLLITEEEGRFAMPSGWGEQDAKGGWDVTGDLDLKNLQASAGDRLSATWTHPANRKYLEEHYGKDCIVFKSPADVKAEHAGAAWSKVKTKK